MRHSTVRLTVERGGKGPAKSNVSDGRNVADTERLVIPVQTHETNCLLIGDAYLSASSQQRQEMLHGVDALITHEPGYCLCISTADCVPVLIYDKKT